MRDEVWKWQPVTAFGLSGRFMLNGELISTLGLMKQSLQAEVRQRLLKCLGVLKLQPGPLLVRPHPKIACISTPNVNRLPLVTPVALDLEKYDAS